MACLQGSRHLLYSVCVPTAAEMAADSASPASPSSATSTQHVSARRPNFNPFSPPPPPEPPVLASAKLVQPPAGTKCSSLGEATGIAPPRASTRQHSTSQAELPQEISTTATSRDSTSRDASTTAVAVGASTSVPDVSVPITASREPAGEVSLLDIDSAPTPSGESTCEPAASTDAERSDAPATDVTEQTAAQLAVTVDAVADPPALEGGAGKADGPVSKPLIEMLPSGSSNPSSSGTDVEVAPQAQASQLEAATEAAIPLITIDDDGPTARASPLLGDWDAPDDWDAVPQPPAPSAETVAAANSKEGAAAESSTAKESAVVGVPRGLARIHAVSSDAQLSSACASTTASSPSSRKKGKGKKGKSKKGR